MCDGGIVLIEHGLFIAVFVLNIIEHTHITEIKRFLDDLIPVDSVCAVSVINLDIVAVIGLALNIPFTRILAVMHVNIKRYIPRGPEKLKHKPFNILGRYPSSPQAHRYLTCGKVLRHNLGKSLYIDFKDTVIFCRRFCFIKLLADIAGQILVSR